MVPLQVAAGDRIVPVSRSGVMERFKKTIFMALAALLAAFVCSIDTIGNIDFGISTLYLVVLGLVASAGREIAVRRAALATVFLTIFAWLVVHFRDPSFPSALRCVLTCIAIGVTAALLISRRRLEDTKRDLGRSRSEVELFANSVPFVLWRSNPQGEIEYLNESWTAVTGQDRWSVLEGQRYNDVVHPDDMEILIETVTRTVSTQTITNLKVRVRQASGLYRWMQIYDNPAFSPLTGLVERFGGLSDVHDEVVAKEELLKVRAELEKSRRELINFTDSVPQILFRSDQSSKVDFYNARFTEVTGRDLHAVIAKQDWIEDVHPDDREQYLEKLGGAFAAGEELRATFRLRHADGSYRWMSLLGRPLQVAEKSEDLHYYVGVTDIHEEVLAHQRVRELNETLAQRVEKRTAELMLTERRYAGLFDLSNITFAEMDFSAAEVILDEIKARGVTDLRAYMAANVDEFSHILGLIRTTRVNEALARLMGYESVSDLVANPSVQNADDGAEVLLRQLEMYFDGIDHIDGRTVLTGKDGQRIPVYFTVTRLTDGLHLSSHVNLSDQERIEGLRQAAQAELARANRVATVGALSASIAHELNQPISSMLMDAQTGLRLVARESPDLEALARILQRFENTAQRVAAIVQRTRDNIVAGRRTVRPIDLCRLASDTHELLEQDLRRSNVELDIVCDEMLPMINGDPVELQQVFVNLVNNAADAMRDRPAPRRIALDIAADGIAVHVQISDTGPGIPEEHIERLFDPFFTTKATGIGMGLQICRSAVEGMGGQLTVSNLPGGGARFSFDLPLAVEEVA